MKKITNLKAIEVLDSQGNPTLLTRVTINDTFLGLSIIPSGTSVGEKEALELRDQDKNRYQGKGVLKAVDNVNVLIKKILLNQEISNVHQIDNLIKGLDQTLNKQKIGANAFLSVSLAATKSLANYYNLPLYQYLGGAFSNKIPVPMMNILNGGRHANNSIDFQEYMIIPYRFPSFKKALQAACEVFKSLKSILEERGFSTAVGLEGGFSPSLKDNEEPLKIIVEAIKKAGYKPEEEIYIGLDVASSEFYDKNKKIYTLNNQQYTSEQLIDYYQTLVKKYPIISIEDGLDQNDYQGWQILTKKLGKNILLIGDDLFVTNSKILKDGIEQEIANGILIKPNQIGSLSETIETISLAKDSNYIPIISHRSGDTEDTFIADLAVGLSCPLIKTGSLSRSERISKYNRLLLIEDELGEYAHYNNDLLLNFKKINK